VAIPHAGVGHNQPHVHAPCAQTRLRHRGKRQHVLVDERADNPDGRLGIMLAAASLAHGGIVLLDHVAQAVDPQFAARSQFHPRRRTVEHAEADLALNRGNVLAQRRLRDVQPLGSLAEIQLVGKRDEFATIRDIHGTSP